MNSTKRSNKKALGVSVLALVLCLAMFVGSTFAWFTDNDTTAVSNVVTGTLDVEIVDEKDNKLDVLEFVNVNKSPDILWEPNATFQTQGFKIQNNGNLWLKYKVVVNNTEDSYNKLNEVIDFTLVDGSGEEISLDSLVDKPLAPAGEEGSASDLMYIKGHMDENAGNEYQGLTLSAVSITVQATQYTKEYDSTTDQYDASAEYAKLEVAKNQTALETVISSVAKDQPTNVVLPEGTYTLPSMSNKDLTISGTENTVIDVSTTRPDTTDAAVTFEGVTIKFKEGGMYDSNGFTHSDKVVYKDCVIEGTQFLYSDAEFINCTFNVEGDAYAVWTYGSARATFTGCTFNTDGKAILVYTESAHTATITVNDCVFNATTNRSKAAIEVGESAYGNKANYTIIIDDCVVNGFSVTTQNATTYGGTNLGTEVWGNKNLMTADALKIVVDGIEVY